MASTRISWYRTPVSKDQLKELTARNDLKALTHAFGHLILYLATTTLTLYFFLQQMWVWMVIAGYIHATCHAFLGYGAAVHELSHGTAFKTKWLNEFFLRFYAFITWNSIHHFKESHTRHHMVTGFEDLDYEIQRKPMPFTKLQILSWLTFDWPHFKKMIWTTVQHAIGNTDPDYFWWKPLIPKDTESTKEQAKRKKMISWARFVVIGHVVLIGVFAYLGLWPLIFTVSFGSFFATFLVKGCTIQQHSGLPSNVPDWRIIARTADFHPIIRFLYWNVNYHVEHHMYAAVPYYNLPKLRKTLEWDLPEPTRGFLRGLLDLVAIKKKQNADPSYRHMPSFPETATAPKMAE
jgi:fatty acid desaturase